MKEEREVFINTSKFRQGNISLILDSYDDIFSDFDPRAYSYRSLSDDFLFECKKAVRDKHGKFELRLLIPRNKHNHVEEIKIIKRLKDHFQKHFNEKKKELNSIKLSGFIWFILGAIIMAFGANFLKHEGFFESLIVIISEPAGWFFFWEGLRKIFIDVKEKSQDYTFYQKMMHCNIMFLSY